MRGLARDGMTMLIVTHEMRFRRSTSPKPRRSTMDHSRIVEEEAHQLFRSPSNPRTRVFLHAVVDREAMTGSARLRRRLADRLVRLLPVLLGGARHHDRDHRGRIRFLATLIRRDLRHSAEAGGPGVRSGSRSRRMSTCFGLSVSPAVHHLFRPDRNRHPARSLALGHRRLRNLWRRRLSRPSVSRRASRSMIHHRADVEAAQMLGMTRLAALRIVIAAAGGSRGAAAARAISRSNTKDTQRWLPPSRPEADVPGPDAGRQNVPRRTDIRDRRGDLSGDEPAAGIPDPPGGARLSPWHGDEVSDRAGLQNIFTGRTCPRPLVATRNACA